MNSEDILRDIESMIAGRATDAVKKRSIDGVMLEYYSIDELLIARDKFKAIVSMERGDGIQLPGSVNLEFRG